MAEQSEVERLTEEAAKIKADLAAAKLLADQREHLLPKLEKRVSALTAKIVPLETERRNVERAIGQIANGDPTTYRLRGPRKPKAAEGAE